MKSDIGARFRELHRPGHPFILANAWDIGSARMLAALGAQAIGTSSSAHGFTLGRPDMGHVSRDEALAHAQDLVAATALPVSGDFENGYGDAPDTVAETVRLACEVGLAGISIEDTALPEVAAYPFELAVERIKAAAAAARALPRDFVLVARADGVMNRLYDVDEALRRLGAFDDAGADCLYIPMLPDMDSLKRVCASTRKPVNALAVGNFARISLDEFAKAGVGRISVGSALARLTHRILHDAGRAMLVDGDFSRLTEGMPGRAVDRLLAIGAGQDSA